jgi:hypothetical protein
MANEESKATLTLLLIHGRRLHRTRAAMVGKNADKAVDLSVIERK